METKTSKIEKGSVKTKGVKITEKPVVNGLMALAGNNMVVKPSAKKDDHEIILVKDDKNVADNITIFVTKKAEMEAAKNAMDMANGVIKEYAKEIQIKEITRSGRLKDSFILSNSDGKSAMYMVTDAYTCELKDKKTGKPDEEKIKELKKNFGEEIVTTENKFVINAELVDKYGSLLYDFITKSNKIEEEDKAKLIQLEQKNFISKGSIEKLSDFAKTAKTTILNVWNTILPICQLRAQGKIK